MTIVSMIKCDEPTCGNIILADSPDKITILDGEFKLNIGTSFSSKHKRLDFCDKSCIKKYIDNVDIAIEPK